MALPFNPDDVEYYEELIPYSNIVQLNLKDGNTRMLQPGEVTSEVRALLDRLPTQPSAKVATQEPAPEPEQNPQPSPDAGGEDAKPE